jgi:hypothetical protein
MMILGQAVRRHLAVRKGERDRRRDHADEISQGHP